MQEGKISVSGTNHATKLSFRSEHERVRVAREPGSKFDFEIAGAQYLAWSDGSGPPHPVQTLRRRDSLSSFARFFGLLLAFGLRHAGDIWRYVVRGNSEAGNRLEAALLGTGDFDPVLPNVVTGLFDPQTETTSNAPTRGIDVVVPVYNGLPVLNECLSALFHNTPETVRIIVCNDASSDPSVAPLLQRHSKARPNVKLLRNKTNLGFVKTVNLCLEHTSGNVVLLNSDCVVPPNWLERLLAPMADPQVASVTPMTNNGELCSIPVISAMAARFGEHLNGVDEIASGFCPNAAVVQAPTGVGFCMAMSRTWLDRVPTLDQAFGQGYGEEVDWCRKVEALGARNLAIGNLVVDHVGGGSFEKKTTTRLKANSLAVLERRYPDYLPSVEAFKTSDPLVGPRIALSLAWLGQTSRVPVYLGHYGEGGAELWLQREVKSALADRGGAVVVRGQSRSHAAIEVHTAHGVTRGLASTAEVSKYLQCAPRIRLVYSCLVGTEQPLEFLEQIVAGLRENDRLRVLFHDYFPICPSHNLLNGSGKYCGLPAALECERCYQSLATTTGDRPALIRQWRDRWRAILDASDDVLVFSNASCQLVNRVWPDLRAKVQVKPHDLPEFPARARHLGRQNIGMLGNIGESKGAKVAQRLAELETTPPLKVFGKIDPAFAHPTMEVCGPYSPKELAELAEEYDLACWFIPSIWPETFSFVTHEAIATGLPVVVFDTGGQAEAVRGANRHFDRILPLDAAHTPSGLRETAAILSSMVGRY